MTFESKRCSLTLQNAGGGGGRNFLNMAKRKDEAQKPFKLKQLLKTETINNNYTVQKLL